MDFTLTQDQVLLRNTARQILDDHCSPAMLRAHSDDRSVARDVWTKLSDFAAIGAGPCTDLCVFLDEVGYASAPGPFTATVLTTPLLASVDDPNNNPIEAAIVASILEGENTATFATPSQLAPDADLVEFIVFVDADAVAVVAVDDVVCTEVLSVDHSRRWFRVAKPEAKPRSVPTSIMNAWRDRSHVIAAAELVGTARRMFQMSLQYAKDREQFGQPIGAFQAIQHKLAESALALERSTAAVQYAAMTVDDASVDRTRACHSAKAAANDCAQRILKDAIQIHGGVGYTWEHDLQMYLRRATMGATQYGTTSWHLDRIADLLFVL